MTNSYSKVRGSSRSGALRPWRYVRLDRLRGRQGLSELNLNRYFEYDAAMRDMIVHEADAHFPHGSSPVDLPLEGVEGEREMRGLPWAAGILAIGAALLALLNTHAITNWAAQQAPTPMNAPLLRAAEGWSGAMASVGLDAPVAAGREGYTAIKALRFPANEEGDKKPQ